MLHLIFSLTGLKNALTVVENEDVLVMMFPIKLKNPPCKILYIVDNEQECSGVEELATLIASTPVCRSWY